MEFLHDQLNSCIPNETKVCDNLVNENYKSCVADLNEMYYVWQ
jgi:uncharacterized protein YecT (DUF1311 family)